MRTIFVLICTKYFYMAKAQKERHFGFHILNVKLRDSRTKKDLLPADYVKLFKKVYNQKIHKESSPNKHCIFRFLFEEKEKNKVQYLSGTFAHFTFIQNDKWFNLKSMDLDTEFKIPDGLFPDAKIADFVFIPEVHRFCYKVTNEFKVNPYPIKKFLEMALDKATEKNQFVQVDVETDVSTLNAILSARVIKKLHIDINYSNADFGIDAKKFVDDDIRNSNSSRIIIEATQKPYKSIEVNQSQILKGAIESSISNGETTAKIIDENNKTQTIKTKNFPRNESVFGLGNRFNQLVYEKVLKIFKQNGNKAN